MNTQNILLLSSDKTNDYIAIKSLTGAKPSKQIIKESLIKKNNLSVLSNGYMYGLLPVSGDHVVRLISLGSLGNLKVELKNHLGTVILLDGAGKQMVEELNLLMSNQRSKYFENGLSIAIFNTANKSQLNREMVNNELRKQKLKAAVLDIDLHSFKDISLVIQSLLLSKLYLSKLYCA